MTLSPEEARVLDLFRSGAEIPAIVKEVYHVTAGRRYQEASSEVQALLRRVVARAA